MFVLNFRAQVGAGKGVPAATDLRVGVALGLSLPSKRPLSSGWFMSFQLIAFFGLGHFC